MKRHLNLTPVEVTYFRNGKRLGALLNEIKSQKRYSKILDVGSGLLNLEIELSKSGFKNFTCIEPNKRYVAALKHFHAGKIPKVKLYKIPVERFRTKSKFNIIVLHDVFYIPKLNVKKILSHVLPFLSRNGFIYFDIYNEQYFSVAKLFSRSTKQCHSPSEIRKFMESKGFSVSIKPINIPKSARMRLLKKIKIYPYLLFICKKVS